MGNNLCNDFGLNPETVTDKDFIEHLQGMGFVIGAGSPVTYYYQECDRKRIAALVKEWRKYTAEMENQ